MYQCILRIRICGVDAELENTMRSVPPRERFEHVFISGGPGPDCRDLEQDDVIFLQAGRISCLPAIRGAAKAGARIILLAPDPAEAAGLPDGIWDHIDDLWAGPCGAAALAARFERLLDGLKLQRDFRLTQYYLDAVINATPSLIWFKDAVGAHLKVNDSFCRTVGKSKEDIEGRGHYYIWDLKKEEYEKGEYVCLETDTVVMEEGKTRVFDEFVKSKQGMRQFKTWKSPLFDDDGRIMGTVGVAHDVTNLATMSAELELLLGSLPFAVMITDAEDHVVNINEKFKEFFAVADSEVLGGDCRAWRESALSGGHLVREEERAELRWKLNGREIVLDVQEQDILDIFSNRIGAIVIFRDVTLEREFERRLSRHANTDALTGLYNRRYFYEHVQPGGTDGAESLLYVDLDHFKSVNDRWGHQAGDQALVTVAELLRASCPQAVVARLGGDEFALYWGDRPLDFLICKARLLVERMREAFRSSEALRLIAPSIGIVRCDQAGLTLDELIRRADVAMYTAKRGRLGYCVYEPELEKRPDEALRSGATEDEGAHADS